MGTVLPCTRDATTKEILKLGSTKQLRKRIFANYLGGVGGGRSKSTTQRIHQALFTDNMIGRVELTWIETKEKGEAERKEKEFRRAYKAAHGRRPAWDRQD